MSDLNQYLDASKTGQDVPIEHIEHFVNSFNEAQRPICCHYTSPLREVIRKERYIDFDNLIKLSSQPDEMVVGCSRGCLPEEEFQKDPTRYIRELCTGCVEEAKAYLSELEREIEIRKVA